MDKRSLLALAWTFAREDALTGKHLLIANLSMLKTLADRENFEVFIHVKTLGKGKYIKNLIDDFGFTYVDKSCFDKKYDSYCYFGTGVHKVVLHKDHKHEPFRQIEPSISGLGFSAETNFNFNKYACYWYLKVLHYLKNKAEVYNLVIDPLFDSTISEFKMLYFCNYYGCSPMFNDNNFARQFRLNYIQRIRHYYDDLKHIKVRAKRNRSFCIMNNIRKYNKKREDGVLNAISKGIDIKHRPSDMMYSIDEYMTYLRHYWFTVVTYSYDENTMSVLRMLDALALKTIPLIAVTHADLSVYLGSNFADFCKFNGLIVNEENFDFDQLKTLTDETKECIINNMITLLIT